MLKRDKFLTQVKQSVEKLGHVLHPWTKGIQTEINRKEDYWALVRLGSVVFRMARRRLQRECARIPK
jgi:hypothetical protein